jgi:hypothetical protein
MFQLPGQQQPTPTWSSQPSTCPAELLSARAEAVARVVAQAGKRAVARAEALVQALTGPRALAEDRAEEYTFRYDEVLADSKLVDIIDSIKPDQRRSLAHQLLLPQITSQEHWWFIQIIIPITRLPTELLHQILLIIIDDASHSPLVLMLVCRLWYTLVTGIWASLKLGTTTPKDVVTNKLERSQMFLDLLVDTEFDRGDFTPSDCAYDAIFAAIQATSRWRSFVVETFPAEADLSEHLVDDHLKRCPNAVLNRLRTFRIKSACEMSPLLDRLLHILGTSASEELMTIEINSPSAISLLAPTYPSIFNSVKFLSLDALGLHNPVDFLPHLRQLEELTASHLSLPNYHKDVNLPFVHTLRHLTLRAVSIQWMSDRTFYALKRCTLLYPLHRLLHSLSTTLPNCENFAFHGYPLDILDGVSARKLTQLSVTSSCSDKLRGGRQLVCISSRTLQESRLTPRILYIGIEATTQAWIKSLVFMSNLEELVIECAQPSSLGVKVLQSLVVRPVHANNMGTAATVIGWDTPVLCPSLKRFGLRYRRWLRPSEHFDLIPDILSIVWSRQVSLFSLQSFRVWRTSDQKYSLELIKGSCISLSGFERLANYSSTHLPAGAEILKLLFSRGSHYIRNKIVMT